MSAPSQPIPASLRAALADRYALEREVGRGGMATVYLARDVKHERPVAVKVLSPTLAGQCCEPDRFVREIRILGNSVLPAELLSGLAAPYVGRAESFEELLDLRGLQDRGIHFRAIARY